MPSGARSARQAATASRTSVGRAARQHRLRRDATVEGEPAAERAAQPGVVEHLRLHRVERGEADLHEVRDDVADRSVRVHEDRQAALDEGREEPGQARLDERAPRRRREEQAGLGAVVIAEVAAVHPEPRGSAR